MGWGIAVGAAMSYMAAQGGRAEQRRMRKEMKRQRGLARDQLSFAQEQWQHFRDTYGDVERLAVADAERGIMADYRGVTERASADVAQRFGAERDAAERRRAAYGIDPSSGRAEGEERRYGIGQATAEAGAINQARQQERHRAEDGTRELRLRTAQMGGQRQDRAAEGVMGAQQNLANLAGERAQFHGELAGNLFSQAGQWAGYAADQAGNYEWGGGEQQGGGAQAWDTSPSTGGGAHHAGAPPDDGFRGGMATNYRQTNTQTGRSYGLNTNMSYGYA